MVVSRRCPGGIILQSIGIDVELLSDEDQDLPGDDFTRAQQTAGKAQCAELDGEAQAIVGPSTPRDDGEIGGAEGVVSDQVGLCRGQREQRLELGVGDGAAAWHRHPSFKARLCLRSFVYDAG